MKKYRKYKGVTVNTFGLPVLFSSKNRLEKSRKSKRKYLQYRQFNYNFSLTAPKDLIIIFDIPSSKRSERDWLRRQLKDFNYSLLQKNVWVGPSPLPQDFLKYLKAIGLFNRLKIFKLSTSFNK